MGGRLRRRGACGVCERVRVSVCWQWCVVVNVAMRRCGGEREGLDRRWGDSLVNWTGVFFE